MQPDPEVLEALAERVEAGEEGREMDAKVWCALNPGWITHPKASAGTVMVDTGSDVGNRKRAESAFIFRERKPSPSLTTSLDVIEATRERLLPGYVIGVHTWNDGFVCRLLPPGDRDGHFLRSVFAPTERHARLAALLRAYAAKVKLDGIIAQLPSKAEVQ